LDRETFTHIVKEAARKKRVRYEDFLKTVPILQTMEFFERDMLCDGLLPEIFKKGDFVIREVKKCYLMKG
jgi:cAMP-dependent protein kinase regulator